MWRGADAKARRVLPPLVVLLFALLPFSAFAATPASAPVRVELHHTPPGVGVVLNAKTALKLGLESGPFRVYSLDEWKDLVIADNRITVLEAQRALLMKETRRLEELALINARMAATLAADLKSERAIADRLTRQWGKCDAALLRCKAGSIWPWVVLGAGGALAIMGGTALAIALVPRS